MFYHLRRTLQRTHVFHHPVLQVPPPLLPLLAGGEDVSGGVVFGTFPQLCPVVFHHGGPAHQLHCGELLQELPAEMRTITSES